MIYECDNDGCARHGIPVTVSAGEALCKTCGWFMRATPEGYES